MRWVLLALWLVGCGQPPNADVVGPFTGTTWRFVADDILLPDGRADFADDLNGDGNSDNQFGNNAGLLRSGGNLTDAVAEMLGSGVVRWVVEITSDDRLLLDDDTVGVRITTGVHGTSPWMGATLREGRLITNRTRTTTHPVSAIVDVPLYQYADPLQLYLVGIELELSHLRTGWYGTLHGVLRAGSYEEIAFRGFNQMVTAAPSEFPDVFNIFDFDPKDGRISEQEFLENSIVRNVFGPDVQMFDGERFAPNPDNTERDSLSVGVGVRLIACDEGNCNGPPRRTCLDRVRDGDEDGVDCGGSCPHVCAGGL